MAAAAAQLVNPPGPVKTLQGVVEIKVVVTGGRALSCDPKDPCQGVGTMPQISNMSPVGVYMMGMLRIRILVIL